MTGNRRKYRACPAFLALILCGCFLYGTVPAASAAETEISGIGLEPITSESVYYYGDANRSGGTPDSYDAALLLRGLVGRAFLYDTLAYCDTNLDGETDARDAAYILSEPIWTAEHRYIWKEPIYVVKKPMLYLYPEETTDVTVALGIPEALTSVYPAYDGAWRVTAAPDGTLTAPSGRTYYALYYEAAVEPPEDGDEGFVIRGSEAADFLEQKLALLGLTEREAEEMIIYWLPQLEAHEYVFIRFVSREAADAAMPLEITPAPDTVIRVWMQWRGLDEPVDVSPQTLTPAVREGFTVVEWGGTELA